MNSGTNTGPAGLIRIGLISDTHGLLRPAALDFLAGSAAIVHAGDIGGPEILATLAGLAPLQVVRGNNDHAPWADAIPDSLVFEAGALRIHVLHDLAELDAGVIGSGVRVVVSGHSHAPKIMEREGVLYVNPGSAGPRRFSLPVSVGELLIRDGEVSARTVVLA